MWFLPVEMQTVCPVKSKCCYILTTTVCKFISELGVCMCFKFCICTYIVCVHVLWCTQSEDNLVEQVLSSQLHLGSKDPAQVTRFAWQYLYPLSHLASPCFGFFCFWDQVSSIASWPPDPLASTSQVLKLEATMLSPHSTDVAFRCEPTYGAVFQLALLLFL